MVCIHCRTFWGREIIVHIAIIAVPIFFIISGYFFGLSKKEKRIKQIKRIVLLNVMANVFYLLFSLIASIIDKSTYDVMNRIFSVKSIVKFVLLNVSPIIGHLWYLSALLYCMLIFYLFNLMEKQKLLYCLLPFLLMGSLVFGEYSMLIIKKAFPYTYVRNFLFIGLPYFGIGSMFTNIKKRILGVLI